MIQADSQHYLAGTSQSNIYAIDVDTLTPHLLAGCHTAKANDVCFADGCSDVFVTASDSDVRVWNLHTQQELLRIAVPNQSCKAVIFKKDGSSLVTGTQL